MKGKIGLVLSGGGTKGIAEAGVLQFLEEKNIHPEVIAGTSAGAIVGGLYAFGKSPNEILDFFKSVYFLSKCLSVVCIKFIGAFSGFILFSESSRA